MRTLEEIKAECSAHGICSDYTDKWNTVKNKRELFEIGCSIQGMDFLVRSSDGGFGFTPEEICHFFRHYINRVYVALIQKDNGKYYDGAIWCRCGDIATVDVTCSLFIDCRTRVEIIPYHICHVFADSKSHLEIVCPESSSLIFHGNESSADFSGCIGRVRIEKDA